MSGKRACSSFRLTDITGQSVPVLRRVAFERFDNYISSIFHRTLCHESNRQVLTWSEVPPEERIPTGRKSTASELRPFMDVIQKIGR
jgi:hypothetical protein